jgi:hypothetical protein
MDANLPADVQNLRDQLDAAERDARALVRGLTEEQGRWQPRAGAWSIAECLDHLATANRVYLEAMQVPVPRARARGRRRSRPSRPGWFGRMFVRSFEPPPVWWSRVGAPRKIRPRTAPPLGESFTAFVASHAGICAFLCENADLDLTGIRFPNPFVPGVRFSLATGLNVIAAHERRHLWQAWRVRRQLEGADDGHSQRPHAETSHRGGA